MEETKKTNDKKEAVVPVNVALPNHWATSAETLWATPLGEDLYQIENVPFYAYGLNYKDIVKANIIGKAEIPLAHELVKKGGHQTFRLSFATGIQKEFQEKILNGFKSLHVTYERANETYVALDMKPQGVFKEVFAVLNKLVENGILSFETCEARVFGTFDDKPKL
ncbi:protein of unknown function [Pustulibacterium marinum]|uniref:DUF4265 domain-containing protein n=1 Tax=Pustulibacterium marinum TaxID=1224947 RepID=A0A1I7H4D5_9FLAO|nr:DUF4265 domain-containing protein [Pustulibacterium marinum]SFU55567.1 protein of unknown function [Pustulibacterium marinum]